MLLKLGSSTPHPLHYYIHTDEKMMAAYGLMVAVVPTVLHKLHFLSR